MTRILTLTLTASLLAGCATMEPRLLRISISTRQLVEISKRRLINRIRIFANDLFKRCNRSFNIALKSAVAGE